MSYIEPNSTIKIFTTDKPDGKGSPIPFDVNMENTVIFTSLEQQENYMNVFYPVTLEKNSYVRVNKGSIKVGLTQDVLQTIFVDRIIASVYNANYMAFKNTSFENKWFYCFIDSTEYVNNNTVVINYHIDPIQTYMFDYTFNQCLIEREHTVSDIFGEHTLPEGLETGPYMSFPASVYLQDEDSPTGESYMHNRFEYRRCIVVATTLDIEEMIKSNGIISGKPKYSYGVVVPGPAGYGGGGEYYSGVRYSVFLIDADPTMGVYRMAFSDNFREGDILDIGDIQLTLTAAQAASDVNVAQAVMAAINADSEYYDASPFDAQYPQVIFVTEKNGQWGVGEPSVATNSVKGIISVYTYVPGTDGRLSEINRLNKFFANVASSNLESAVIGAFMMPYEFYPKENELTEGVKPLHMNIRIPNTFYEYRPRNNKLFCSPYNELFVTNNSGNDAVYKYENFANPSNKVNCVFSLWGNVSMNPGMYCAPMHYNGNAYDSGAVDDELTLSGFPMCSFTTDSFKAWLSQNAGVIGATAGSLLAGWATAIGSAYSTSASGLAARGIINGGAAINPADKYINNLAPILNRTNLTPKEAADLHAYMGGQTQNYTGMLGGTLAALGTLYDHSRRPPQSHGTNNGNLIYQAGQMTFAWYYKQIKKEYAEIIDKFFDMYGYKTNRVGTPNLMARPYYSYVKTVGCSIDGMIPGDMKAAIEGIFDKGIRFWTPYANFGNYDPDVNDNRAPTGGD